MEQVAQNQDKGFKISPPTLNRGSTPPAAAPTPAASSPGAQIHPFDPGVKPEGLGENGAIIGTAIVLFLAMIFVFIRSAIRGYLIKQRAHPDSAGSAGWAAFAFLIAVAITITFGAIGSLWQVLPFIVPMAVLDFVSLLLAALLFRSAVTRRR